MSKYVAYKSAALLALAAAVGAGVPFRDEAGREYFPAPGIKRPGRPRRNGVFTRTGAKPRSAHRWLRRAEAYTPGVSLTRSANRWARFHKASPIKEV